MQYVAEHTDGNRQLSTKIMTWEVILPGLLKRKRVKNRIY